MQIHRYYRSLGQFLAILLVIGLFGCQSTPDGESADPGKPILFDPIPPVSVQTESLRDGDLFASLHERLTQLSKSIYLFTRSVETHHNEDR